MTPQSTNYQANLKDKSSFSERLLTAFPAIWPIPTAMVVVLLEEAMSQTQAIDRDERGHVMGRVVAFLYGIVAYTLGFVTLLYAIGFVTGLLVPKTIDDGGAVSLGEPAGVINLLLLTLFAVQHSVMARPGFKRWWTQFVPKSVERSTYVLFAALALDLLFWQWRPLPTVVWHIADPQIAMAVTGLSLLGWVLVFASTFMINHFELFGLHQVANNLVGRAMPDARFKTPVLYKLVRHPIYLGLLIAFWVAPTMTIGHLLFAVVTTAYILVGIWLEERDLVDLFGDDYRRYRDRVSMLLPWRKSA
jgi:methanethiol S-methyltransferase